MVYPLSGGFACYLHKVLRESEANLWPLNVDFVYFRVRTSLLQTLKKIKKFFPLFLNQGPIYYLLLFIVYKVYFSSCNTVFILSSTASSVACRCWGSFFLNIAIGCS